MLPRVVWLTGLCNAGKTTLAWSVHRSLIANYGIASVVIDGDDFRTHVSSDLDYSPEGRAENTRRLAAIAKMNLQSGVSTLIPTSSPIRATRNKVREHIGRAFLEVYVDCPIAVCESREQRGRYEMASRGELPNFPGVGTMYERPLDPECVVRTDAASIDQCTYDILRALGVENG